MKLVDDILAIIYCFLLYTAGMVAVFFINLYKMPMALVRICKGEFKWNCS